MAVTQARMIQRSGTSAEWSSVNPVLADGEFGWDKTVRLMKVGDGVTAWNSLAYETGVSDAAVAGLLADTGSASYAAVAAVVDANLGDLTEEVERVAATQPTGIVEGRAFFMYGPSRGVGVTAQRIHFDRIRERIRSGFYFNASVGGYLAADTAAVAYGARSITAPRGATDAWLPTAGVATWATAPLRGAIAITWPFGNDARLDGRLDLGSTTAKARASAINALHALVALQRSELRIESARTANYGTTSGSPVVTGLASKWYRGMLISGTGIPANTYVGTMINGGFGGFRLSSSRTAQVDVNATATNASVALTFFPVLTGTWAPVVNQDLSSSGAGKSNTTGATSTYVLHLDEARVLHWLTTAIDDSQYVAAGAPFGGDGGAGYSIVIDGGTPIVGTTADQHRVGQLNTGFGNMAVDLGFLAAGVHTIVITSTGTNKAFVDDGILVGSLTPPTVVIMKEVELPAAYYLANAGTGASLAKTTLYNGFIDDEVALWPADDSVITLDPVDFGYDVALHVSNRDGANAHFNDAGEEVMANGIMAELNLLGARVGLVWD